MHRARAGFDEGTPRRTAADGDALFLARRISHPPQTRSGRIACRRSPPGFLSCRRNTHGDSRRTRPRSGRGRRGRSTVSASDASCRVAVFPRCSADRSRRRTLGAAFIMLPPALCGSVLSARPYARKTFSSSSPSVLATATVMLTSPRQLLAVSNMSSIA